MEKSRVSLKGRLLDKPRNRFGVLVTACLSVGLIQFVHADDIKTLSGKTYSNVSNATNTATLVIFSYQAGSGTRRIAVPFSELPDDLKRKYHYDPFEEGLLAARQNKPVVLGLKSAYRLSDLEAAKKKAQAEGKHLGFVMVWDSIMGTGFPMGEASRNALADFYTVFGNGLVLVFVRHENELSQVPAAVKEGFFGPEEGGFAPNMAVVTADCSKFICEIPMGGKGSNGQVREAVFRKKIAEIKKFDSDLATGK